MPRTLLARLFLLLAVVMTLSALSWAGIFVFSERQPRARQLAQLLSSVTNLTRAAIVAADPALRLELLDALSRDEGLRIDAADDDEPIPPPPSDPMLQITQELLQQQLGPHTYLTLVRKGEQALFLRTQIEGDDYWIALPLERLGRPRSLQWIGWGALAAAVALMAAAAFVSRLTRPLRNLARAARQIGAGEHPPPLPEDGPDELATVAQAFNQMDADLSRLDQDRALILAGVSHDLRTPLTRLRMGIEMSVEDEESRNAMSADVEEMDRTIGQFLDFARSDGGETMQEVDLHAILADLAAQYQRRQFQISAELSPMPPLTGQPQALRRLAANLIDNALRYAPGQAVDVGLGREGKDIVLIVADRGPGIPPDQVERLKRPFTQLDDARSNTGGAGLGLAIVERILRQHRGSLTLLPREGGGLLARVTIPAS
ncbi:MAG: HAMP domain-containing protein [Rhodocyclaceae bacterium]|nr:MAG: HAMP domain-containing protein [Rhodocyclaceae bacterium]